MTSPFATRRFLLRFCGHWLRATAFVLVIAATATTSGVLASQALAAPYNVWACSTSSGAQLGTGDWQPERVNASLATIESSCLNPGGGAATGTAGAMNAAAVPAAVNGATDTSAGWRVASPAGLEIKALDLWWHNQAPDAGMFAPGRIGVLTSSAILYSRDGGSFGASGRAADLNHQQFPSFTTHGLAVRAVCLTSCNDPNALTSATYSIYRAQLVVDDLAPPTGSAPGLTDGMAVAGPVPILTAAEDVGSGMRDLTLRVDGTVIQRIGDGRCATDIDTATAARDFAVMRPCQTSLSGTLTLPPDALPDYEAHRVTVVAADAAGQERELANVRVVAAAPAGFYDPARGYYNPDLNVVADRSVNGAGGGPALIPFGLPTGKRLVLHRTVRWNTAPSIKGRLTTPDGTPIAGARVWLATSSSPGAWQITGPPIMTSATGNVIASLPTRQASRLMQLVYFPYTDTSGHGTSHAAVLFVRAATSLIARHRSVHAGGRVELTGRLYPAVPAGGSVIGTLQLRANGHWRTFRQVRFRPGQQEQQAVVRFRHSPPGTVYKMRLRVPAQTGLLYAAGTSRTVTVTVR